MQCTVSLLKSAGAQELFFQLILQSAVFLTNILAGRQVDSFGTTNKNPVYKYNLIQGLHLPVCTLVRK